MNTNITLNSSELLITESGNTSKEAILLFLPGISGKAFSDRFQPLVDVSLESGYPIARLDAWNMEETVNDKTYAYMQGIVLEAITYLLSVGYKNIIGVGKSFGGGILLLAANH